VLARLRALGVAEPQVQAWAHDTIADGLAACEALEVRPIEAVYVGDDPLLDVEGAQKAGLRAVWINRFERMLPAHIRPDATCTTLYELEQWLSRRT